MASSRRRGHAIVVRALADAALHVAVLVLDDAGHQRLGRVEQVAHAWSRGRRRTRAAARPRAAATFSSVCVVRKPSWTTKNGVSRRLGDAAGDRGEVGGLLGVAGERGSPQPVSATAITSSWPAWMLSAWLVSARAPMWKTTGSRLPAMTYRTSFISTRPWPAVKFVTRPPASAKPSAADADECSDSGSMKPQRRAPQVGLARRRPPPGRSPPSSSTG